MMKCPECKSDNIEELDIYDTETCDDAYIEKGNAICNDCDTEFDFVKTHKLILTDVKTIL